MPLTADTRAARGDAQPVYLRQTGSDPLEVELAEAMLPVQGVDVPVTMRTSRQWMPGAASPVTHVLGPVEDTITLTGVVRDELSGDGAAASFDADMRFILKEGREVELEWGTAWSKVGLIESYEPTVHADGYLEYSIEYAVHTSSDPYASQVRPWQEQTAGELAVLVAIAQARSNALGNLARATFSSSLVVLP